MNIPSKLRRYPHRQRQASGAKCMRNFKVTLIDNLHCTPVKVPVRIGLDRQRAAAVVADNHLEIVGEVLTRYMQCVIHSFNIRIHSLNISRAAAGGKTTTRVKQTRSSEKGGQKKRDQRLHCHRLALSRADVAYIRRPTVSGSLRTECGLVSMSKLLPARVTC